MRNLKKLSLALMLTTLFSISFTSCIDTDVDPAVIAIYDAQADLIAAQASVQNAEAAYLLAQAAAEQAAADELAAITARYTALTVTELMEATAAAELAVEEARIAMLLAQAEFDQDMAQILAAIRAAQNVEAGTHAADYATAMGQLATLRGQKLTLLGSIATKELYMQNVAAGTEMTWETYLANLERDVLAKEASVTANEEYIVRANAYLGDYDAMVAALAVADAAVAAKQAEIDALDAEDTQIDADILAVTGNFDQYITDYETMEGELVTLNGDLTTQEGIVETLTDVTIPDLNTAIADYDGTTTTLEGEVDDADADVVTAQDDVDNATTALGTVTAAPSAGDAAIDPSTSLYDDLYNAQLIAADKADELSDMQTAFALLTITYNEAATALNVAQVAWDASTFAADLATAESDEDAADTALQTAKDDYAAAKTAFEAAPTGSVDTDGAANPGVAVDDLGELGIHSDLAPKTYMRVATWVETVLGSGLYIPATFEPTQYTLADLPVAIQALKDDVVSPNNLTLDAQFSIWEQDGTAVNGDLTTVAALPSVAGGLTLTAGEVVDAVSQVGDVLIDGAYFLEVEADDSSITNLYTFNVATTVLGSDDFTARALGSGDTAWTAVLDLTDDTASYDSSVDANGEEVDAVGSRDALTAYANVWNAQLETAKKQYLLDTGDDTLVAAQATFDAQKELFDNGVANMAALEAEIVTADANVVTADDAVTTATTALGTVTAAPAAGDADIDPSTSLYDDLYNAQLVAADAAAALATHTSTTLAGYEAQLVIEEANLVAANNMVSEIEILIVRKTADIAALTAEYEALIATPLYAAQQVRILEIADEKAVLTAEKAVLVTEAAALAITISFEGSATILAIDNAIIAAQAVIDGAPAYYAMKAAQIALGEVTVENLVAEVAKLNEDIAALDAQIAAKEIEAAGYLALLQAALAG